MSINPLINIDLRRILNLISKNSSADVSDFESYGATIAMDATSLSIFSCKYLEISNS
jgi:hypothetical protein